MPSWFRLCVLTCAGEKQVQVRLLARGSETVLGDAASDCELFLTNKLETRWVGAAALA